MSTGRAAVVVIGAGPAGLATAGALRHVGIEPVVLEQATAVGNSWRNHYARLHLHTTKRFSHLPHLPFPASYPRYPSRQQVVDYLELYARHFDIQPRLGVRVERVRRDGGEWTVETTQGEYRAAAVVMATSYNSEPNRPAFPGMDGFGGRILHSAQYHDAEPFAGQRVLVVGCGNSGAEIALDLAEHGVETAMVVRGPTHVLPRELNGVPLQYTSIVLSKLPLGLADTIAAAILRLANGDLRPLGIQRPKIGPNRQVKEQGRVPLIDVGTIAAIRRGRIRVMPGVVSMGEGTVRFADGRESPFDAVILATGYKARLDRILEGAAELTDARGYPKWHGVESSRPGLYFIGFRNPVTGALREIEIEARRIAAHLAGR